MTSLLAVDPGIDRCGVALFLDGVLVRADHVGQPLSSKDAGGTPDVLDRVVSIAGHLHGWLEDHYEEHGPLDLLIVEWPQIYTPGKSKAPGKDIVLLGAAAASVAVRIFAKERRSVRPDEWKGQAPKAVIQGRVVARLSDAERKTIAELPDSRLHNTIDAIGLGMWHLDRFR